MPHLLLCVQARVGVTWEIDWIVYRVDALTLRLWYLRMYVGVVLYVRTHVCIFGRYVLGGVEQKSIWEFILLRIYQF